LIDLINIFLGDISLNVQFIELSLLLSTNDLLDGCEEGLWIEEPSYHYYFWDVIGIITEHI